MSKDYNNYRLQQVYNILYFYDPCHSGNPFQLVEANLAELFSHSILMTVVIVIVPATCSTVVIVLIVFEQQHIGSTHALAPPSLRLARVWPRLLLVDGVTTVGGERRVHGNSVEGELRRGAGGRSQWVGSEKQAVRRRCLGGRNDARCP